MNSFRRLAVLLVAALIPASVHAQSTISNETWDIGFGKGFWGVVLPEYSSGTADSGEAAFRDNLDDVGGIWQLDAIRHFHGTRTSFETRGFFALALSNRNADADNLSLLSPATGAAIAIPAAAGSRHLDADVYHYGFDAALRDTWQTRFGGLSAGLGLSTMAFDQRFNAELDGNSLFEEDLDSNYFGGTGFVGWDGYLFGRASKIDLIYGYYDLEMDYAFRGDGGNFDTDANESAFKVELTGTTQFCLGGRHMGLTAGVMYLSDIATIERVAGRAVSIGTDDAVTMNVSLEWLW